MPLKLGYLLMHGRYYAGLFAARQFSTLAWLKITVVIEIAVL